MATHSFLNPRGIYTGTPHRACSIRLRACSSQPSSRSMQHQPCSIRLRACNKRPSSRSTLLQPCNKPLSFHNISHLTCNRLSFAHNMRAPVCNILVLLHFPRHRHIQQPKMPKRALQTVFSWDVLLFFERCFPD